VGNKIIIECDDQFTPNDVTIIIDEKKLVLDPGDINKSDNNGCGQLIVYEGDNQISMMLPKSAIMAIREVLLNWIH